MKYTKIFLLLALIITLASVGQAFVLDVEPTKVTVRAGDTKTVNITVYTDTDDRFVYHLHGYQPWMSIEEIGRVSGGEEKTAKLYISPLLSTQAGTYQLTITVESFTTGETQSKNVYITVTRDIAVGIDKIYVSGSLKPTGTGNVSIHVKNVGTTTLSNLKVETYVGSKILKLAEFENTVEEIQPGETVIVSYEVEFPAGLEAGKYFVNAKVYYKEEKLDDEIQYFDIASTPVLEKYVEISPAFIGENIRIIVINKGNIESETSEVSYELGSINTKFFHMKSGPQPVIKGGLATWIVPSLEPGETYEIILQVNYLPLIIVILVVVFALYFVAFKVRTVQVTKRVIHSKKLKDTEVYTVSIEIKNNTGKDITSVTIEDEIPMVFKIKTMTGIKPKVKKLDYATMLTWKIRKMKDGEERILSYQIIPMVGLEGSFKLPRAEVTYKIEGKKAKTRSGSCTFGL